MLTIRKDNSFAKQLSEAANNFIVDALESIIEFHNLPLNECGYLPNAVFSKDSQVLWQSKKYHDEYISISACYPGISRPGTRPYFYFMVKRDDGYMIGECELISSFTSCGSRTSIKLVKCYDMIASKPAAFNIVDLWHKERRTGRRT